MKNIWLLMKTNIKRNVLALLITCISAGMLCLILYFMGELTTDEKITLGVIDYDKSILSEDFKSYLTEQLDYSVMEDYPYDELATELLDKNISAIIEIPDNFYEEYASGRQGKLIVTSTQDYENAAFLEIYMNSYLNSILILAQGAQGEEESFRHLLTEYDKGEIKLSQTSALEMDETKQKQSEGFIYSIGFYLMIIFGLSLIIAFMLVDDRSSGVFHRIQATPVKPIEYIIGSGIFGLLLCGVQICLYTLFVVIMKLHIGVPIWSLVLMMGLYALFTICFTLAISLAFPSKNAVSSILIGFSTFGCIIGGAYFPLDMAPESLQKFSKIVPQYWFMDALRNLQNDITANITPNIIVISLYSILFLLIGAVLFAQNYKQR